MNRVVELSPFYRGDDYAIQVTVRNKADQSAVDITGWCLSSTMKLSDALNDEPQIDKDGYRRVLQIFSRVSDNDNSRAGIARLLYPNEKTNDLIGNTFYQMDIQAETAGSVITLMKGKVLVLTDVTRRHFEQLNYETG